jgi:hypothetical protein
MPVLSGGQRNGCGALAEAILGLVRKLAAT